MNFHIIIILKLLLYYKNKTRISKKEFELLLIKEKEDKCNSVINFNVIDRYGYYDENSTDKYSVRRIVNPLFIASYHNCKDIMDMLINKYGAYIYIKDNENNTLLHIGAMRGETPLHKACIHYRYGTRKYTLDKLLKRGANINAQDNEGNIPLINLSRTTLNEENVIFLIKHDADINKSNNKGETPLIIACKNMEMKEKRIFNGIYLIKKEANINIQNNEGETPIFEVCRYLYSNVLKIFIENGTKLNIKNKYGDSLLKVACLYNIRNIEFLIDIGVK
ncbi:ankyrin [Anaeromyces robustus]|uniref:Ankyrin n=1 Tax=Anaeromyces robustus TaxID=1754192 RepID=A0A1Y1WGP6_9FUNG|nr:ankyrin [Anaeromyces robustus]|eukprot:ORX72565.1 ankyrin [Anaeromyces robustus]